MLIGVFYLRKSKIEIINTVLHQFQSSSRIFFNHLVDNVTRPRYRPKLAIKTKKPITAESPPTEYSTDQLLEISIDLLGLNKRSYNVLRRNRIGMVRQLIQYSEADILKMKYAGTIVLDDIKDRLALRGLKLSDENPVPPPPSFFNRPAC